MRKVFKPEIIKRSIDNNWLHVFLVKSPILGIVSKMIIDNYELKKENILIINSRKNSLEIFDNYKLEIEQKKFDRYREKLFFDSPVGRKILKKIKTLNKDFIIYAGGAWREVNWMLKDDLCKGHIYIEEGQGTYRNFQLRPFEKIKLIDKIKSNFKNRAIIGDKDGFMWRDDVHVCIGLDLNSFPKVPANKKIKLEKFRGIKNHYKQKTLGFKTIGLTCSASRVHKKEDWKIMLQKLINHLPQDAIIKPHPSFMSTKKVYNEFLNVFNEIKTKRIKLCSHDVIIELEMMYEKKHIIGPQSSLSIYAEKLGSKYDQIKLF